MQKKTLMVLLDEDLHRKFKEFCFFEQVSMTKIVEQLVKEFLKKHDKPTK